MQDKITGKWTATRNIRRDFVTVKFKPKGFSVYKQKVPGDSVIGIFQNVQKEGKQLFSADVYSGGAPVGKAYFRKSINPYPDDWFYADGRFVAKAKENSLELYDSDILRNGWLAKVYYYI